MCSWSPARIFSSDTAFFKEQPQNSVKRKRKMQTITSLQAVYSTSLKTSNYIWTSTRHISDLKIPSKMLNSSFQGSSVTLTTTAGILEWNILYYQIWLPHAQHDKSIYIDITDGSFRKHCTWCSSILILEVIAFLL